VLSRSQTWRGDAKSLNPQGPNQLGKSVGLGISQYCSSTPFFIFKHGRDAVVEQNRSAGMEQSAQD
jgi:hypothetical protein